MKAIIQRNLPLNQKYFLIEKKYIPLVESFGTCCDNCGQLIANIATVRGEDSRVYSIGFDCLETFLINNSLLSSGDIEEYQKARVQLPKIIRAAKKLSECIENSKGANITGMLFEKPLFSGDKYFPFWWLQNNNTSSRNNDYLKLKDVDFKLLIETLKNIFPKLQILTNEG